jgi:DNA-binding beta-propeller fold protein YncE
MAIIVSDTGYVRFIDLSGTEPRHAKTLKLLKGPEKSGVTLIPNEFSSVTVTPDGTTALVTEGNEGGQIFQIDIATMTLKGSPWMIGDDPSSIVVTSDGLEAWILDDGNVHIVDLSDGSFTTVITPTGTDEIGDLAITPDESRAIMADADNNIYLLDTSTWTVLDVASVNPRRFAELGQIAVSPDGSLAIVTSSSDQSITFVSIAGSSRLIVKRTIRVKGTAEGIAFTADGQKAVVTLLNTDKVAIIDVPNRLVDATVSTRKKGLAPAAVTIVDLPW